VTARVSVPVFLGPICKCLVFALPSTRVLTIAAGMAFCVEFIALLQLLLANVGGGAGLPC
jgi:hypothetical protein